MTRRKGQHTGSTLDELRAQREADARNAGWRSAERGHTGDEPRYLRWRTGNLVAFLKGREDYAKGG